MRSEEEAAAESGAAYYSITLCWFNHAFFELLLHQLFKPYFDSFTPFRKKWNSLSGIQQQNPVGPDSCVPSVVWHLGWHGLELVDPI